MKGTIFSSDFCIDESNNVRLLEINTDTAFINSTLGSEVDVSPLVSMMTGSIDSVYVIYKDAHHANFVEYLSQSVATAHSHSFTGIAEYIDSIYPTVPTDADNKFIIRLAYDENAILDSTYAKGKFNLLKLFNDNSNADKVIEFYYSSSATGVIDNIDKTNFSPDNIIDAVTKKATEAHQLMKMYKIGHPESGSTDRWTNFINAVKDEDSMIQQYHYNSDELEGGKITSLRNFNFVYGSDLEQVSLGCYKVSSYFEPPVSLDDNYPHDISSPMRTYYKYCFATNHMAERSYGVTKFESLISSSGTFIEVPDVSASNNVLSYFVSGSPQDNETWYDWNHNGTSLPDGSHATGSLVIGSWAVSSSNNLVSEIILSNGATAYTSPNEAFLVRNELKDIIEWEYAQKLFPTTHSVWISGSGFTDISASNLGVTKADVTYQQINVEDDDNYQLSGSNVLVHNAPCFVAGTKVTTKGTGSAVTRAIEDVTVGEDVLSYNLGTGAQEYKRITKIQTSHDKDVVYYEFSNSSFITCTYDHPFYVSGSGWSAYKPALSEHTDRAIVVGDKCLHTDGNWYSVTFIEENIDTETVYNLDEVTDNNNFFAGGFLVHNRWGGGCCFVEGTEITLANDDVKNIEDVVIGDEVVAWDGEALKVSKVIDIEPTVVGDRDLFTLKGDGISNIEFTPEHPFLTKQGWKALIPEVEDFEELKAGDEINCCGEWKTISSIDKIESTPEQRVFNFTVKDLHNYIANGIIVHNK